MNALLVTARSVQFVSSMLLFGTLVFVLAVARPAWRTGGGAEVGNERRIERLLLLIALFSAVAGIGSGIAWLALQAATISGLPLNEAVQADTLALIVLRTMFGRVWTLRLGLVMALCALLFAAWRSPNERHRSQLIVGAVVVAGVYLGTLAWAGHAATGEGGDRVIQLVSDVVHLLAAGAWLGAVPGLVLVVGSSHPHDDAERATRRFSTLGVASVSALILTGVVNAWYLVSDVPVLFGTAYGRLLLAKLMLFAVMLALAATNRWYLTPRLAIENRRALRTLRRNAILETVAGIAVVTIVGALGVTVPAAHQPPVWPFDHTLSWRPADESPGILAAVAAASIVVCIGAGVVFAGIRRHRRRDWLAGLGAIALGFSTGVWLLAEPAYPTSYMAPPVPYSVVSIARGAKIYAQDCSVCHGRNGQGDGPAAGSLPIKPANLAEHASNHRPGDLFWWIAHGKPGTPMLGFSPSLADADVWNAVQYLYVQADAADALKLTSDIDPWQPIIAPDFTFEPDAREQESLTQQRGRFITLVVLYTVPRSFPRLRELVAENGALERVGVRVIAVALDDSALPGEAAESGGRSIFAVVSADMAKVYALFARRGHDADDVAPEHAEFLVDRQGYLRARWIGVPDAAAERTLEIRVQAELLSQERPHTARPKWHAH